VPDAILLSGGFVAAAAGGFVRAGDPAREFTGVSIDSRTIAPGELYVAIRGERFDGGDFAGQALAAGAAGVLLPAGRSIAVSGAGVPGDRGEPVVIEAADTVAALQALARSIRRASGTKVVAVTGSAGKTTTKEAAAALLSDRYRVTRNRGNLNNHIGLPLSLVELRHRPDIAVVELGMNHAGEIRTLVGIAEPDVRVWTNVGDAHMGFFESMDAIADAKAEILEGAGPATRLVANADDDRIAARLPRFAGTVTTFGIDREADVRAADVEDRGIDGMRAAVRTPAGSVALDVPLIGRGNLANVLAAVAVASGFDIGLDALRAGVARLKPPAHRGEVIRLAGGVTVIDDSYNANPTATRRALEVLRASRAERRIAVLGEMLELGGHAVALHEDVGRAAARAADWLIAVGGAPAAAMAEAAVEAGLDRRRVEHFATSDEAAARVRALVEPGDLVLVKGSRGVRTDRVVERLLEAR
jgi:UDP-N-acetylmuramoyl-tripeptide--D-alanyl-D-alanine ligase